jgi:hypothetical protein
MTKRWWRWHWSPRSIACATVVGGEEACDEELEEATVIEGREAMAGQLIGKSKDLEKNLHGWGIYIYI